MDPMATTTMEPTASDRTAVDQRIERLSTASLKRILEPDVDVPGEVGDGQLLPDELLTLSHLPELFDTLTPEQKKTLAREEFGSIVETGVRFESVLMAGFSIDIVNRPDLTDPRVNYLLHEMGEETRHSRLFVRLLTQVRPKAKNPIDGPAIRVAQRILLPILTSMPSLFCLLVLSGEEVPDLMQKLASEHPDTDPMIKAVSKYHRQEEARHLAFARMLFPEQWASAGRLERFLVRHLGSHIAIGMFDTIVHPGRVRRHRPPDLGDLARRQPQRGPHRPAPPRPTPAAHPAARGQRLPARPCPQGLAARLRRRPPRPRPSLGRGGLSRCRRTLPPPRATARARRCCRRP